MAQWLVAGVPNSGCTQPRYLRYDRVTSTTIVRLRSYNGQVTGPTLRFKPGESVRILLANELTPNPDPMP